MAGGIGEAASIAGIISLAAQTIQAITTITAFCKAYKNVHDDIVRASTDLEVLRRILLQVETTATFALVPNRCPPALLTHLRDCISACRQDLQHWNAWNQKIDLDHTGGLEKIWKKIKIAADKSHFSKLSDRVSAHVGGITLCCQLLNCDLNVQTLDQTRHLNSAVEDLKVNQYDFHNETVHQVSDMSDAMHKMRISNDQGINSLRTGIDSLISTNDTGSTVTRRYQSILEDMRVEFRVEFTAFRAQLDEYQKVIQQGQAITSSAQIDTAKQLTEPELTQVLIIITADSKVNHKESLKFLRYGRNHRHEEGNSSKQPLYHSQQLETWNRSKETSLIMIQTRYSSRFSVRDFSTNVIDTLQVEKIPTLWALKHGNLASCVSIAEVLNSLIHQALYLNPSLHTESHIAATTAAIHDAVGTDAMFHVLASVLGGMRRVYILFDVELLTLAEEKTASPFGFLAMFRKLADCHRPTANVKVILVSYTGNTFLAIPDQGIRNLVVRADALTNTDRKKQTSRRAMRDADVAQKRGLGRQQRRPHSCR